ncbi:MAG: AMP-dependent synthetase/ligase [Spirochaetaceae bacterium]
MTANETLPKRLKTRVAEHEHHPVQYVKDENETFQPVAYGELWNRVTVLALALKKLGVARGDHVGIMSDNRQEWLVTDFALLSLGAVDVPRGSDSTEEEIAYILRHADCKLTFAENPAQCEKILSRIESMPELEIIVLFDDYESPEYRPNSGRAKILSYAEVVATVGEPSAEEVESFEKEVALGKSDDLATLLYTSGTTGEPKGVMLTHRGFLFQMDRVYNILHLTHNDIFLAVLPIWHSFERAVEYIVLNYGASMAYSRPIGKIMLADMAKIRPTWMTSVPRIWEGIRAAVYRNVSKQSPVKQMLFHFFVGVGQIHADLLSMFKGLLPEFKKRSRIADIALSVLPLVILTPFRLLGNTLVFKSLKQRLGGRFVAGVSGGGALPSHVDSFFQAAGIKVLEGYGLTETAPVLAVRLQDAPVRGTVGPFLPDIQYKIIGEQGEELGPGEKGTLWVKSQQIMQGYYKKPEESSKVLQDGWLNTGDICMLTVNGECRILGRAKDTIVLLGGENVEPQPIEESITRSDYIDQAMVVGQDQKFLGALIVANMESIEEFARREGIEYFEQEELLQHESVVELIHEEIQKLVNKSTGFKSFELIYRFTLLPRPFEVGEELTQTLKIRRNVVYEKYRREIDKLFG